jgi:hypothetical protein
MKDHNQFQIGDQVRISDQYWHREIAGRNGAIGLPPEGVELNADCLWVELDVDEWLPGVIDGSEVSAEYLQSI